MPDREKVVKEAEEAIDILAKAEEPTFWIDFVRCAFENALALLKEQDEMNVDAFMQWCIDSHIMGDATVRGIKYWVEKFKEGR